MKHSLTVRSVAIGSMTKHFAPGPLGHRDHTPWRYGKDIVYTVHTVISLPTPDEF